MQPLRLIGLCAAWCGVCREFEPAFRALVRSHPALDAAWHARAWLDVEEPEVAQALGDVDIDTFPSIALGRADGSLLLLGPILPNTAVLARLLDDASQHMPTATHEGAHIQAWQALLQYMG